jgi:hypothetical protein
MTKLKRSVGSAGAPPALPASGESQSASDV